jgi:hypothetical protein
MSVVSMKDYNGRLGEEIKREKGEKVKEED